MRLSCSTHLLMQKCKTQESHQPEAGRSDETREKVKEQFLEVMAWNICMTSQKSVYDVEQEASTEVDRNNRLAESCRN